MLVELTATGSATSAACRNTVETGDEVAVKLVAPADVRIVQYLALAPASEQQMQVALSLVKSLLRGRILAGRVGSITLERDGLNYGEWKYEAFYRGCSSDNVEAFDGGLVMDQTLVLVFPSATSTSTISSLNKPKYQPIGAHARGFRELVAMALRRTSIASADVVGQTISAPHSLLLHAPSGAGKTTLVHQIADEMGANLLVLDGGLLASPQLRLEDFFSAALRIQPCVLLLEDLELLFPMILDETKFKLAYKADSVRVAVIGTVSVIGALHSKVRQLFTEEVFLDICMGLSSEDSQTVGVETFESEIAASAREISSISNGADTLSSSVPDVSWDDIGGLERVKQNLIEMVVWPLEKPKVFRRMGISPPLGMVLHGPPGTGKTMLAKATANASGCNFLNLSASDIMKAEIGESEKAITRAFDTARALSPCMIFIDEFQSLFGNRSTAGQTTSRMISQLLMELDALKAVSDDSDVYASDVAAGRIFVLAATNALSAIDPAFLQPGRFENVVYVGLPNADERQAILEIQRNKMPWSQDVKITELVNETEGANAASLIALCQAAAIQAMQRIPASAPVDEQCIAMVDFVAALEKGNFDFQNLKK
ncbi:hypothetical protein PInf_012805 [Phytophthora infestans]|nr:hypothetical protein PInf_012805 [Phytophthora infestans]